MRRGIASGMQEAVLASVVALAGSLVAVIVVASLRVLHVVRGAWAATGGGVWTRPRSAAPEEEQAPASRRWPPRSDEMFFPTYLAGKDTSAELVAALARARAVVRVDHIAAVCRSFRVRCEMRDVDGRVLGTVEADGTLVRTEESEERERPTE
jgi:hypothetical protein